MCVHLLFLYISCVYLSMLTLCYVLLLFYMSLNSFMVLLIRGWLMFVSEAVEWQGFIPWGTTRKGKYFYYLRGLLSSSWTNTISYFSFSIYIVGELYSVFVEIKKEHPTSTTNSIHSTPFLCIGVWKED